MPEGRPGGHPTYWTHLGQGPRPALLLHCSLSRGGSWSGLMRRLGDTLTATVPDLPGHGLSGDWDRHRDLHALSTAVAADLLPPGRVDLIGHSFGATVALRLALEQPERVRSLILIEPVLFAAARGTETYTDHAEENRQMAAALAGGDLDGAARAFTGRWGVAIPWEVMPDFQRDYFTQRIHVIDAASDVLFDDTAGMLEPGRMEALRVPVLLIEGETSPPIVGAVHTALAARLPMAWRAAIGGAGHMAPITHPDVVAEVVSAFLAETGD
ncbi:alpha/beta fold hydrolase [Actibacterium sp. D379-3]